MLAISTSFGDSWIAGTHTRNRAKIDKRRNTIEQNNRYCVTHAKEAHKPDQIDQQSPGTDHQTSRPTRQCTRERRWPEPPKWGRPNPWFGRTWTDAGPGVLWREDHSDPPEGGYQHFHVYLGGNRPQGAIKGASHHSHHTHHLKASLSHSLVTFTP